MTNTLNNVPRDFTKKPVLIKAIQWTGDNLDAVLLFCSGDATYELMARGNSELVISTLEDGAGTAKHVASLNDWIIRGVKGEFYPCKPDIFDMTYELSAPSPDGVDGLDERMKAAGWLSAAELIAGAPLDAFMKHAGVNDLETFGQWLEMRRGECLRMQGRYDLGERDKSDDMYEWTVAHSAVFGEAHVNFKAAMAGNQAIIDGLRGEVGAQRVKTCAALKARNDAREERDQQAQRIGELASHLEFAVTLLTVAGLAGNAQVEAMRAALSASVGRVK